MHARLSIRPILTLWAAGLLLAGCGGPRSDAPGAEGRRRGAATRIVSLSPALTEILFALGAGDRVVGVTRYCDYPPEVAQVPKVGGFVDPSVEQVLALDPDLVLVSPAAGNRAPALALQRAGVRLEVIPAETVDDAFRAIVRVGELCGVPERARAKVTALRAELDAVRAAVAGLPRVRTLFCVQAEPLVAAGVGTLPDTLLQLAGGTNVVTAPRYPKVGIESVYTWDPEVILQTRMDRADTDEATAVTAFWRRWTGLRAVQDGRVYVLDGTPVLRAGPRLGQGARTLARLLHPEAAEALP